MRILTYKAYHKYESSCGLEVKVNDNNTVTVIFTELPDNPGVSVGHLVEHVATLIYREYLSDVPVGHIVWLTHDLGMTTEGRRIVDESYEQVLLMWNGETFGSPRRVPLARREWELCGLQG
ncbi:MAG: hypothetical protein ACM3ON_09730 [Chloroflexota bacterium]